MPERTVRAVVTTYVHKDGAPRAALRGEVVDVHADHVKAFDEGEDQVPEVTASAAAIVDEHPVEKQARSAAKK